MNDNYHRLWILLRERIAREAQKRKHIHMDQVYYEILAEMAVLEAEAVLGE